MFKKRSKKRRQKRTSKRHAEEEVINVGLSKGRCAWLITEDCWCPLDCH